MIVSFLFGIAPIQGVQFLEERRQDKLDKYQGESWNMTLDNYPKVAQELCERTFGPNYSYAYTDPVDAAYGDTTELNEVVCEDSKEYHHIPIKNNRGEKR